MSHDEMLDAWAEWLEFEREREKEWGRDGRDHSWEKAWRDGGGNPVVAP